jgi:alpha-galactosidase
VWSYPLREGDDEEVIFNMVNALLLRVHQSGHLAELEPRRRELVKEALDYYKSIRAHIPQAMPFWPLGLPDSRGEWVSFGLRHDNVRYLAVWRIRGEEAGITLPIPDLKGHKVNVSCAYPQQHSSSWSWDQAEGNLRVEIPAGTTARLFEIHS